MAPATERRSAERHDLAVGMEFHHDPSHRDYPARTINVSRSGLRMQVPATVPLRVGHAVELRMGYLPHPQLAGRSGQTVPASVIRIDRSQILDDATISVAVRFDRP